MTCQRSRQSLVVCHPTTGDLPDTHDFQSRGQPPQLSLTCTSPPGWATLQDSLDLDPIGYVKVTPGTASTSVPGVFAAGDVQDPTWRQAVTAAGRGQPPVSPTLCGHALDMHLLFLNALAFSQRGLANF